MNLPIQRHNRGKVRRIGIQLNKYYEKHRGMVKSPCLGTNYLIEIDIEWTGGSKIVCYSAHNNHNLTQMIRDNNNQVPVTNRLNKFVPRQKCIR